MNEVDVSSVDMYCDTAKTLFSEFPVGNFIQTIVFDLIAGILATGFLYRFQQGIEISHPIYSVIFSNITFTTAVSFLTFILNIIVINIKSCGITYLLIVLSSSSTLINNVSLLIIAFLRYHLLVTVKRYTDNQEIDLIKIRKVALIANWLLIIFILVTRGFFFYLKVVNQENTQWAVSFTVILIFLLPIITLIVYYKMDVGLKLMQNINEVKDATLDIGEEQQSNIDLDVPHLATKEKNIYGGIYIGEIIKPNICQWGSKEKQTSSNQSISSLTEVVKSSEQKTLEVGLKDSKLIPSDTVLVNPFVCTANHLGKRIHDNSIQPEQSYGPLENESVLPNQVFSKEDRAAVMVPISNKLVKSYQTHRAKRNFLDEDAINKSNDENMVKLQHQPKKSSDIKDLDKIFVIGESISSTASSQKVNTTTETKDLDQTTKDYNEGKEHKSIRKSCLICLVYISLMLTLAFFIYINRSKQKPNFFLIIVMVIAQKLFRTFATILTSIYCFELIKILFSQIFYDIIFHCQDLYIRIREAI